MTEVTTEPCPFCQQKDQVRALPKRDSRKDRKRRRTGRDPQQPYRDSLFMLECARCERAWFKRGPSLDLTLSPRVGIIEP